MAIFRFQFTIPYFTNMPGDVVTNDWWLSRPFDNPDAGDFDNARDDLIDFYNAVYSIGGGNDKMAPWMIPALAAVKAYNINDTPPRAPVYSSLAILDDNRATTAVTPLETAICVSFQGVPLSGVPQARRRGRVFLGGFADVTAAGDEDQFPVVSSGMTTGIAAAASGFGTAITGHGWQWVVYSRINGTGALVDNGWVDNALDTQRRREVGATARVVFP